MGVFKEEAHTFETVSKKQVRIYNDAADFGFPYNISDLPQDIERLLLSVKTFKELDIKFPDEKKMIRKRETWNGGVSGVIRIGWEIEPGVGVNKIEHGTEYTISFNRTPKHPSLLNKEYDAFISVNYEGYSEIV